jgi:hypothetical protein
MTADPAHECECELHQREADRRKDGDPSYNARKLHQSGSHDAKVGSNTGNA